MFKKRILSVFLAVGMLLLTCPSLALASEGSRAIINETTGRVTVSGYVDEYVEGLGEIYIVVPARGKTYANFAAATTSQELFSAVSYVGYASVTASGKYTKTFTVPGITSEREIYVSYNGKTENINEDSSSVSKKLVIKDSVAYAEGNESVTVKVLTAGHTYADYTTYGDSVVEAQGVASVGEDGSFEYVLADAKNVLDTSVVVFSYAGAETYRAVTADELVIIIYVDSASGSDSNSGGDVSNAFRTVAAAQSCYALYAAEGNSGEIILCEGEYPAISANVNPIGDAYLEYKAQSGDEVVISNTKKISLSALKRVSDAETLARLDENARGYVYEVDLSAYSITADDVSGSYDLQMPSVYLNGKPQTLAKWPNQGYESLLTTYEGTQDDSKEAFSFTNAEFAFWNSSPNMYLEGYFLSASPWIRAYTDVRGIDSANSKLTYNEPSYFGVGAKEEAQTEPCRVTVNNFLEGIDVPGEWYIDAETLKLYYYKPTYATASDTLEIAITKTPTVEAGTIKNVAFRNLHIKGSRVELIKLNKAENVEITGCVLENGQFGVIMESGKNCVLDSNAIRYTLGTAIWIKSGANSETLDPSGNKITNNHIYHCGTSGTHGANNYETIIRMGSTSSAPTIIGDTVQNNLVHASPYGEAVLYKGVENTISNNEFYNLIRYVADAGVIYAGRQFATYANKINNNYIHNFGHTLKADGGSSNVAIYWDDYLSGQSAEGNIIVDSTYRSRALLTVGRDSSADGNLVVGTTTGMIFSDRDIDNFDTNDAYSTFARVSDALAARYPKILQTKTEIDADPDKHFYTTGNTADGNMHVDVTTVSSASTALSGENKTNHLDVSTSKLVTWKTTDSYNNTTLRMTGGYDSIFVDHNNHDWRIKNSFANQYSGYVSEKLPLESNFDMDSIGLVAFNNSFDIDKSFRLAYPINRAVESDGSVTLAWEKALYADRYTYEIATDAAFTSVQASGEVYENYADVSGLSQNQTYYWRVTAHNDSREMGDSWSSTNAVSTFVLGQGDYKLENIKFYDASGIRITDMDNLKDASYMTYDFVNKSENSVSYDVIAVIYDSKGDMMKQVLTYTTDKNAPIGTTTDDSVALREPTQYTSGDLVYVFVWDDALSMNPLMSEIILE